jgi:hypothetical protein
VRHGDGHSAKQLNPLGDRVDALRLLFVMFVEQPDARPPWRAR